MIETSFPEHPITQALLRSEELSALIRAACEVTTAVCDPRSDSVRGLCAISINHGNAVQSLLLAFPGSAIALVRPQYEGLVRAAWAAYAATEAELGRLLSPLSLQSQQEAKKLPGVPEMLRAIDKVGPPGAAALLSRARERLGDGLNSFIHGGIHPIARERDGYPITLLIDILKNSNALSMLTLIVLASISGNEKVIALVPALHENFADVLPALEPLGG
jgi:hypothetical protein